jgi:hypothetical protein
MKKASIKYEAFSHINTYLENKKINVVNFKLVENEVIKLKKARHIRKCNIPVTRRHYCS